jgi:ABC-type bacteriocin/lantibiotic exporter with double-glycine peptidase domain
MKSTVQDIRVDLRIRVFGQREAECGNTSLKSALWFLGKRVSARQLARLAGATPEGIEHAGLIDAARRAGAAVFARADGTIDELRWFLSRGLPAIVGWWSRGRGDAELDERWSLAERKTRDCGHFSVVSGVDRKRILLMDPQWHVRRGRRRVMGRRWMKINDFRDAWYDTDTATYVRVDCWYMVVHRGDERFAAQLGAGADHAPLAR